MSQFTPRQIARIKATLVSTPASDLTSGLRAQLATAAQGAKADTALQDASAFATAAQGALAATALQDASAFATAAQGANADTAFGWGNHVSAGYQAALAVGVYENQLANTVVGGTLAAGAWNVLSLNVEVAALAGASLAANAVTLAAGTYLVRACAPGFRVGAHRVALFVDGVSVAQGSNVAAPAGVGSVSSVEAVLAVAAGAVLDVRHWTAASNSTSDGGAPVSTGDVERYTRLVIMRLA